jgi:hypothetical protein
MFDTWGPYTCATHDKAGIDDLWKEFRADAAVRVEEGVGIYVVSVEGPNGDLVPWYVGQTYKSFSVRLKQHFEKGRFANLFEKGSVKIILIARAKDGQIIPRQLGHRAIRDRKFIDWLEIDLIDKCRKINPQLLNRQFVSFLDNIWVGGYRGRDALDPEQLDKYPAYLALAKILRLISGR